MDQDDHNKLKRFPNNIWSGPLYDIELSLVTCEVELKILRLRV